MNTVAQTIRAILISAAAMCGLQSQIAQAAPDCTPQKAEAAGMSEGTYADVQASMELLAAKKYNEAIEKLTKIADKGSAYEKAVVNYNLGFAHSSKEDHANATKALAKSGNCKACHDAHKGG